MQQVRRTPTLGSKKSPRLPFACFAFAILCILEPANLLAAELTQGNNYCDFRLSGPIERGDFEVIKKSSITYGDTICLDSRGGNFSEGILISQLFTERSIQTRLEPDAECYSSCAIIFMGGAWTEGELSSPNRQMHVSSRLGFHAPYLVLPGVSYSRDDIENAYGRALQRISEVLEIGKHPYAPGDGLVPLRLVLEMLRRGPNELFEISSPALANEFEIEVYGAEFPREWDIQSLCNACVNHHDGRARAGICETAQVVRRNEEYVDVGFFGVDAEAGAYCVIRLYASRSDDDRAYISKFGMYEDELADPSLDLIPIHPLLTVDRLGNSR